MNRIAFGRFLKTEYSRSLGEQLVQGNHSQFIFTLHDENDSKTKKKKGGVLIKTPLYR